MENKITGFGIGGLGECAINVCNKKASCFTRTLAVCQDCFDMLKIDNIRRFKRGIEIPANWDVLKNEEIRKTKFKTTYDEQTGKYRRVYL